MISKVYQNHDKKLGFWLKGMLLTGGLAIWRGDEYMLNFLFANPLQLQPMNNAEQQDKQ